MEENGIEENEKERLVVDFDLSLIEHLGSQLYTTLPPIIAELISNSYDADAEKVQVNFKVNANGNYDLEVEDDGLGIAYNSKTKEEICRKIKSRYLTVGRKKRVNEESAVSPVKGRSLQGKKGIGKLAGFGISNKIKIETTSNFIKNTFILDYEKMIEISKKSSFQKYYPEHIENNVNVNYKSGTKIILFDIKRKTKVLVEELAQSISKRLQIFEDDFCCIIKNESEEIKIENSLFMEYIRNNVGCQFSWVIPDCFNDLNVNTEIDYFFKKYKITGEIMTSSTPLSKDYQGIVLYARNKMAQDGYMFSDRANDNFYSYLYGFLTVDYIDEDDFEDNISTARGSLVWEKEIAMDLKEKVNEVLKKVQVDWRKKRKEDKAVVLKEKNGIDCKKWIDSLNKIEQRTAQSLVDALLEDSTLDSEKTSQYIGYMQDFFEFDSFKNFAAEIIGKENVSVSEALEIVKTWEIIESKELAKISEGRVNAIDTFEKMINDDASETKTIQPFLEKFPWILDPSVENFQRELTFSKMLKDEFPDSKLDESDRRLDFFVRTSGNNSVVIYELKRPSVKIKQDYLDQCTDYITFTNERVPNHKCEKCVLVVGNKTCSGVDARARARVEANLQSKINFGDFEVYTYSELLQKSRVYNKEIISLYRKLQEKKS